MALTGSAALDVLIGLAFVYLLFSLLCSALQEAISVAVDKRATMLVAGLRNLLNQPDSGSAAVSARPASVGKNPVTAAANAANLSDLQQAVYEHPLVDGLYDSVRGLRNKKVRVGPSYIPARTFAVTLLDLIAPSSPAGDPVRNVRNQINLANLPSGTKQALLAIADEVGTSRDALRKGIEDWFDGAMGRVSGWYKRWAQAWVCIFAIFVTLTFNVDTLVIGERLVKDETVRAAVAQQGVTTAQRPALTTKDIDERIKAINASKELGLPLGHTEEAKGFQHLGLADLPEKVAGLLISIIMLSLGAPFWFDALNRLARLRTTGVPEKPHDTASTA
jgi:hypothetical protein